MKDNPEVNNWSIKTQTPTVIETSSSRVGEDPCRVLKLPDTRSYLGEISSFFFLVFRLSLFVKSFSCIT